MGKPCQVCGVPVEEHPRCEGCGIYCGQKHIFWHSVYGGHLLCSGCIGRWKTMERIANAEVSWDIFLARFGLKWLDKIRKGLPISSLLREIIKEGGEV